MRRFIKKPQVNNSVKEKTNNGKIEVPISRKENSIIERCVSLDGDKAITEVQLLQTFDNYSLVKCVLKTGRTHQIRVHMAYIGHPLISDTLYGNGKSDLIDRQALHSYQISFLHPVTLEKMIFVSEPNFIK